MKLLLAQFKKKISKVILKFKKKNVPKETNIGVRKRVTFKKIKKYHQEKKGKNTL